MADPAKPGAIAPVNMSKPSLARDLLITATQAYKLYPGNCSGAVNWVLINMVDPQMPYLVANQLMNYFAQPANGWKQVSLAEASALANQGTVVIGGLAEPGGHGHVITVLPGPWKSAGGYMSNGSMMPKVGSFPPSMSTSLGSWPGAVSNGDKTVYDPWFSGLPQNSAFRNVTLWTKKK